MKKTKEELKKYFEKGDKPTQQQYSDLIDSFVGMQQVVGEDNRRFVIDKKGEVLVRSKEVVPEYTFSEISDNKLALLKDGVKVKEVDLLLTDTSKKENIVLTYNPKGSLQNNISGSINDFVSVSSKESKSSRIFSSRSGVSFFEYVGEVYNRLVDPVKGDHPDKIEFKIFMETNNAMFSNSFNSGGIVTQKLLLFEKEIKSDVRDLLIHEEFPIVTQMQSDTPEESQWSSITYNEVIDKEEKIANRRLFYLRNLRDDAVLGAEDLNVKFTFDLSVSYADNNNVTGNNHGFLTRINSYGMFIKKIK